MAPVRSAFPEGAPCWADVQLPDVETGKRFYGDLFGWTFDEGAGAERGYYTAAYSEDRAVAALAPLFGGAGPAWTVHFAVRDAYATAARVTRSGGRVLTGPLSVGTAATMALVTDRDGGIFGLWQAGSDLGFEVAGEPGAYCWAELRVRDTARADAFYETVFSYAAGDAGDAGADGAGGAVGDTALPGDGNPRDGLRLWAPAGTVPSPATAVVGRRSSSGTPLTGGFLVHFGTAELEATTADALRLGGEIQVPAHPTGYGRVTVLADDQGALFALREV
ncbi:VOC family protein [Streptomyces sp. NPDC001904]|uniref:VOC family protein n=1 Tax=Streptomyces sp. NPDC001904 TaxID=3154531 RepID=UPI00331EAF21